MINYITVIRYLEGRLQPAEAKALTDRLQSSEEAYKAFLEIREEWLSTHNISNRAAEAWERLCETIHSKETSRRQPVVHKQQHKYRQLILKGLSYAALVAVTVLSTWFIATGMQNRVTEPDSIYSFETRRGEKCSVILPDSSIVRLNSSSVLKLNIASYHNNRTVELDGEAYFMVSSDPENPFTVTTADYDVIATGTAFNVTDYHQISNSEVVLVEGSLLIESDAGNISLNPGEKAVYTNNLLKKGNANQDVSLSWINNEFIFSQISFSELIFRLENWFDIEIFCDKTDFDHTYSGSFKNRETIEQILDALKKYENLTYHRVGNTIYLKYSDKP